MNCISDDLATPRVFEVCVKYSSEVCNQSESK